MHEKLLARLHGLAPGPQDREMLEKLAAVRRVWDAYTAWDGVPAHLDPESFTLEDLEIVLSDLQEHAEAENRRGLQVDNAHSIAIAAWSTIKALPGLPRVPEEVDYI